MNRKDITMRLMNMDESAAKRQQTQSASKRITETSEIAINQVRRKMCRIHRDISKELEKCHSK